MSDDSEKEEDFEWDVPGDKPRWVCQECGHVVHKPVKRVKSAHKCPRCKSYGLMPESV